MQPVDTPKYLLNIFEILPDGTNKTTYIRKKEKTRLFRETGMAGHHHHHHHHNGNEG